MDPTSVAWNTISAPPFSAGASSAPSDDRPRPARVAVILPTLNERDNVSALVAGLDRVLSGMDAEIIFVDDDSVDGTADVVTALARTRTDIRLIRRIGRRGLSSAVIEGALATTAEIIVVMDADMQHDEAILGTLIDAVAGGDADLAIGSRYVPDGSTGDWSRDRVRTSLLGTRIARLVLRREVHDPLSGYFAIRQSVLLRFVRRLSAIGFKILLDILLSSDRALRVVEVPFGFRGRTAGASKMDSAVLVQFVLLLLDKLVGRWIPPRLILFGAVGCVGVGVQLSLLWLFLDVGFTRAQTAAVLITVAVNFFLNNVLTYGDQRLRGWSAVTGLLSFVAVCSVGLIANVGIGTFIYTQHHRWWLAGLAGAAVAALWNYAASSLVTWGGRR